jgi:steroid 5-alpha reductase family enzyme
VAATGLAIESISDASKSSQKRTNPEDFAAKGLFSVVRHPNYLGEVIFWLGSYMTGVGR